MRRIYLFSVLSALLLSAMPLCRAQAPELPADPAVRKGVLDNGMTYYIRHNDKPAQRAEFYLASNVGAIQENPSQDGLAHFLEHMCFNGTKNFPGKGILNYLESIGASFGGNVNASTGVETTQYMLNNIPLVNDTVVDSCLLIMHDYSHFVTCDPAEIDAERGVILEEKRTRNSASWRVREKSAPYMYGDTKYATTTVIGTEENLKTFKPETLVDFYHTWYRPDMQAVIVVGDVDVDAVEAKIKTIFADIPAPVDPRAKDIIPIPENEEPLIGIVTDPEQTGSSVLVLWKGEPLPEAMNNSPQAFMIDIVEDLVTSIMDERLEDIAAKSDAPFLGAGFGFAKLCETCKAALAQVQSRDGESVQAFAALMTEIERMRRFGFNDDEVERAKTELLSRYETAANKAGTRKNPEFIRPLINNFFDNTPYMDPADSYQLVSQMLPMIPTAVLNQYCAAVITKENVSVIYNGPEKEGLANPTEEQFAAVLDAVASADIQAAAGEAVASEFVDPATLKGSKVKKVKQSIYGSEEWTLRNGVKVVLLPTEYEKDRISFNLVKWGGQSLIEDADMPSFESNLYQTFQSNSGVAGFSSTQVSKMLSGKQVGVSYTLGNLTNGISGSSTRKDFETAMQLLYLNFTQPRFDAEEYARSVKTLEAVVPNLASNPSFVFQRRFMKDIYGGSPRAEIISEEILQKASLETIERVTRDVLFKDAAGATMFVVGDFDKAEIRPLIEKYVGSLPKGKKAPIWQDKGPHVISDNLTDDFAIQMQAPKVTVLQVYKKDEPYSYEKTVVYDALEYILDMVYVATLREEEGGTYGASSSISSSRLPKPQTLLQVYFDTNEEKADNLRSLAIAGLSGIAENGPDEEQFNKTISNMLKKIPERKITNGYWQRALQDWYFYGDDTVALYEKAVKELTPDKIRLAASDILSESNFIEVVMRPEK